MDKLAKQQAFENEDSIPDKIGRLREALFSEFQKKLSDILGEEISREKAMGVACFCIPRTKENNSGTIYFARSGNLVKIGFATDIKQRISTLKTISSTPPKLIFSIKGTAKEEREIHGKFSHLRHHGEWFHFGEEIKSYINSIKEVDLGKSQVD
jgi:hypothetical protein